MYMLLDAPEYDPKKRVLASMKDEYGGRARIVADDHCFVLQAWINEPRIDKADGESHRWKSVTHWFREAAEAMRDMVFLYETIDDVPGAKKEK